LVVDLYTANTFAGLARSLKMDAEQVHVLGLNRNAEQSTFQG
jgi:hypothetical protein